VWHPGGKTKLTPHYGLECNSRQPPILWHIHSRCHAPYHLTDIHRTLYAHWACHVTCAAPSHALHIERNERHAPVSNTTWDLQSSTALQKPGLHHAMQHQPGHLNAASTPHSKHHKSISGNPTTAARSPPSTRRKQEQNNPHVPAAVCSQPHPCMGLYHKIEPMQETTQA